MKAIERERRKYPRYDTELQVYFRVKYDIETKVKFRVLKSSKKKRDTHKHSGISRNVSCAGLCFCSHTKLREGDLLSLEVYPPNAKRPVKMEGEVRWSDKILTATGKGGAYYTGVLLMLVNGKSVIDSIYFDKKYKVAWSIVLDSLFSNFKSVEKSLKKKIIK